MFPIASDYPVKGRSPVTWAIIVLCGAISLVQFLQEPALSFSEVAIFRWGAHPALIVFDILPWNLDSLPVAATLVTSMFMHAGVWHVVGNMLFFHCFSGPVESLMGSWRYAIFYLLCGIGAGLTHSLFDPDSPWPLVGASGAVAGVLAAHTILLPWTKIRIPSTLLGPDKLSAWVFTAIWFGMQFLEPLQNSNVAWLAHLGGVAVGILLAPLLSKPGVLVMAPTPDTDEVKEHGVGYRIPTVPAVLFAAIAVIGLPAWTYAVARTADAKTVANAKWMIAENRLWGDLVPRQVESGLALYREAAPVRPVIALKLAHRLREGKLVPRDDAEALRWLKVAADGGNEEAKNELRQ